jgi:REP-associated tyrosine transposase
MVLSPYSNTAHPAARAHVSILGWLPARSRPSTGRWTRLGRASATAGARGAVSRPRHAACAAWRSVAARRANVHCRCDRAAGRDADRLPRHSLQRAVSVQHDHVHLIAEADGASAWRTGIRGLVIRIARRLNRALGRRGRVWGDRYHARLLRTPREVRNALVYVLQNWKKHLGHVVGLDPCSSAAWFPAGASPPAHRPGRLHPSRRRAPGWRDSAGDGSGSSARPSGPGASLGPEGRRARHRDELPAPLSPARKSRYSGAVRSTVTVNHSGVTPPTRARGPGPRSSPCSRRDAAHPADATRLARLGSSACPSDPTTSTPDDVTNWRLR